MYLLLQDAWYSRGSRRVSRQVGAAIGGWLVAMWCLLRVFDNEQTTCCLLQCVLDDIYPSTASTRHQHHILNKLTSFPNHRHRHPIAARTMSALTSSTYQNRPCPKPWPCSPLITRLPSHRALPPLAATPSNGDDDLVTRWVGRLFGQKVLEDPEPGGLKRLSDTALQELYPAPLDEFADPVVRRTHCAYKCIGTLPHDSLLASGGRR